MTKEEAANIISGYEVYGCGYCLTGGDEVEEALRLAVDALKQEPVRHGKWIYGNDFHWSIPVDFIESWIDSNMASTEDRDFYAEDCIRRLVQDWRKKNERCNSHRLYKKQNRL